MYQHLWLVNKPSGRRTPTLGGEPRQDESDLLPSLTEIKNLSASARYWGGHCPFRRSTSTTGIGLSLRPPPLPISPSHSGFPAVWRSYSKLAFLEMEKPSAKLQTEAPASAAASRISLSVTTCRGSLTTSNNPLRLRGVQICLCVRGTWPGLRQPRSAVER